MFSYPLVKSEEEDDAEGESFHFRANRRKSQLKRQPKTYSDTTNGSPSHMVNRIAGSPLHMVNKIADGSPTHMVNKIADSPLERRIHQMVNKVADSSVGLLKRSKTMQEKTSNTVLLLKEQVEFLLERISTRKNLLL